MFFIVLDLCVCFLGFFHNALIGTVGIYLDWDVIVVKPFDELLANGVVLGAELKAAGFGDALGVAVILARPQEPFMLRWQERMAVHFTPESCYACHAIQLSRYLAEHNPAEITLLPPRAFYEPGWEARAARFLFDALPTSARARAQAQRAFDGAYAVHLFESHDNTKYHLGALTEAKVLTEDTNFNLLVRSLLDREPKYILSFFFLLSLSQ